MTTLITGETWGEAVEPALAYLLREAEQPFATLRPKLESARANFRAALDGVSDAQAEFTPASGEGEEAWGIGAIARHIASVEPSFGERVRLLGTGQSVDSLPRPASSAAPDVRPLDNLRQDLERSFAEFLDKVATIDGRERLDTLSAHRRFGPLNCRGWVVLHTLHLRDHARQIDKIKALDGYPSV
jgi:hypothetical protein